LLETPLLNILNFQTLIATKASRVRHAAGSDGVLEFGLRRAQGIDGGLAASRAAFIGGADATSNVLAGRLFGIPVRGTHAHAWVMAFDTELEAFEKYAEAMPNNCVFLVDTYDTLEGVRNAVKVGLKLREKGHALMGVRLDSGDLTELSIGARKILDEAGFPDARIVASNDLNENLIAELKAKGATITIWGVGTQLATAYDQPALGGVYKLGMIRDEEGRWEHRIKLSETPVKISNPGLLSIARYVHEGQFAGDLLYGENETPDAKAHDITHPEMVHVLKGEPQDLLVPIFKAGQLVYATPSTAEVRERALRQLAQLPANLRGLKPEGAYPLGLSSGVNAIKQGLLRKAREAKG
jgi:nicotinate phosphoribosyltransferase